MQVDQLATNDKISLFSVASGDPDATIAEGTYTVTVDEKDIEIVVPAGKKIGDVVKLINETEGNDMVSASIMSDGTQSHLTLTSKKSGVDNGITVTEAGDPNATLGTSIQEAQNAVIFIDGWRVESGDNKVDDAVSGMTFDLHKKTDGEVVRIDVDTDTAAMKGSINDIVDAYNDLLSTVDKVTKSEAGEKGISSTRAALASDPMVNGLVREFRAALSSSIKGPFGSFAGIGITTKTDGTLEVDSKMLKESLDQDPAAIERMFTGEDGLIQNWQDISVKYIGRPDEIKDDDSEDDDESDTPDDYISKNGLIDDRIKGLEEDLSGIKANWLGIEKRYNDMYQRSFDELVQMDLAVQKMKATMGSF